MSRKFAGTPVMVVTVENMLPTYSWHAVSSYFFGFGGLRGTFWETFTIDGLDALNGTYAWEMSKTAEGCIAYPTPTGSISHDFTVPSASLTFINRTLSGTTGCTVGSTSTVTPSLPVTLAISRGPATTQGMFEVRIDTAYATPGLAAQDGNHFRIQAFRRLFCHLDYDASLAPGSTQIGALPGSRTTSLRPYSSSEVWITHRANPSGRCVSPYTFDYDVLGNIHAEIIDDVS